ncbi:MAG: flavodoxin [Clostridia bacterium]|nr:flavodoxin [Clostridia bacterium]
MKTLIAYFSVEVGKTAGFARLLAEELQGDLFEIRPETPYTKADIDWRVPSSRCNEENRTGCDVPLAALPEGFAAYERVLIGFPVWYGCAPNIINTFCKSLNFAGKEVYLFATSGGGGLGKSEEKLVPYLSGAAVKGIRLLRKPEDSKGWIKP